MLIERVSQYLSKSVNINKEHTVNCMHTLFRSTILKVSPDVSEILPINLKFTESNNSIYRVYLDTHRYISAIVSVSDREVLWIDNDANDADLNRFIVQNGSRGWTIDLDVIMELILLKLNYLGEPRLLRDAGEIPVMSDLQLHSEKLKNWQDQQDKILSNLKQHVSSPKFTENSNNLELYIWTQYEGIIYKVIVRIGNNPIILHSFEEIAKNIGNYIIPR